MAGTTTKILSPTGVTNAIYTRNLPNWKYVSGATHLASDVIWPVATNIVLPIRFDGVHGIVSGSGLFYIMIFDSATVPADGTAPDCLIGPIFAPSNFSGSFRNRPMANGISWAVSTTEPTLTLGGAVVWLSAVLREVFTSD